MRILKNYYLRWFVGAFLLGVLAPPLWLGSWALFQLLFSFASTYVTAMLFSQPAVIVTNPSVEVSDPLSPLVALFVWGVCSGIVGLVFARLTRHVRRNSC